MSESPTYKSRHGDCRAGRHGVSGSLTTHCTKCCPVPPMSPQQVENIASIFARKTPDHELMLWRLRLYCGHVTERKSHRTHKTVHNAFTGSVSCPDCGLDPATIVEAQAIELAGERPRAAAPVPAKPKKPTRAELEARVAKLEAEQGRLRAT